MLLTNQWQVRCLLEEAFSQQQASLSNNKLATIKRLTSEWVRINQLQKRQQMRVRHKQDETDLEQIVNAYT